MKVLRPFGHSASLAAAPFAYADSSNALLDTTAPFSLPSLDDEESALVPAVDAKTMEIHHGRHHKSYVDNLE